MRPATDPTDTDLQGEHNALEVSIGQWHFVFEVDPDPSTGELREIAHTVARVTGVDRDAALAVVLAAVGPPILEWEAAA